METPFLKVPSPFWIWQWGRRCSIHTDLILTCSSHIKRPHYIVSIHFKLYNLKKSVQHNRIQIAWMIYLTDTIPLQF